MIYFYYFNDKRQSMLNWLVEINCMLWVRKLIKFPSMWQHCVDFFFFLALTRFCDLVQPFRSISILIAHSLNRGVSAFFCVAVTFAPKGFYCHVVRFCFNYRWFHYKLNSFCFRYIVIHVFSYLFWFIWHFFFVVAGKNSQITLFSTNIFA